MSEPRLIRQAYRFELAPTAEQAVFLGACAGAARFWFNQALDEVRRRLEARRRGEDVSIPWSYKALCSEFDRDWRAERCGWQREVVCGSYQGGFESLGLALKNFSEGRKAGRRVGFPSFRRKGGPHTESVIFQRARPLDNRHVHLTGASGRCARRSGWRSCCGGLSATSTPASCAARSAARATGGTSALLSSAPQSGAAPVGPTLPWAWTPGW
jgi:hypothetical protein